MTQSSTHRKSATDLGLPALLVKQLESSNGTERRAAKRLVGSAVKFALACFDAPDETTTALDEVIIDENAEREMTKIGALRLSGRSLLVFSAATLVINPTLTAGFTVLGVGMSRIASRREHELAPDLSTQKYSIDNRDLQAATDDLRRCIGRWEAATDVVHGQNQMAILDLALVALDAQNHPDLLAIADIAHRSFAGPDGL